MMRFIAIFASVAVGAGAGALSFKLLGEQQIGGAVKGVASRLGFTPAATSAQSLDVLDFVDKIAPGSKSDLTNAVIITVVASVVAAAATAVVLNEIGEEFL